MSRDYYVGDLKIRKTVFTGHTATGSDFNDHSKPVSGSRTLWVISRNGVRLDAGLKLKNARRIALKISQSDKK